MAGQAAVSRRPLSYSRQGGRPHIWYSPDRPSRGHDGVWYSGGNGSSLLVCDTCGLSTEPRRWGSEDQKIKRQFDRAHRIAHERGYRGRHRAPIPRPVRFPAVG